MPKAMAQRAMQDQAKVYQLTSLNADEEFALNLHIYFTLKIEFQTAEQNQSGNDLIVSDLAVQVVRLKTILKRVEKRNNHVQRWKPHEDFLTVLANAAEKRRQQITSKMIRLYHVIA